MGTFILGFFLLALLAILIGSIYHEFDLGVAITVFLTWVVAEWWYKYHVLAYIKENWVNLLMYFGLYLITGLILSLLRFRVVYGGHVARVMQDQTQFIENSKRDGNTQLQANKLWNQHVNRNLPTLGEMVPDSVRWLLYWPVQLAIHFFTDFVWNFGVYLHRAAAKAYRGMEQRMKRKALLPESE